MALIYFYDATKLDQQQLTEALQPTDHYWSFVDDKIEASELDPETEVISVFVTSHVTRDIIEQLPKLRLIACRSTGFNNIDLEAAQQHDITVVNVPTYGESTVAEYAFTLATAIMRKIPYMLRTENELFHQQDLLGSDLHGKTLGVIGTGNIGQHAIKIGNGYGMNVIAYDPYPNESIEKSLSFRYAPLDEVLSNADVITIHAPYLPSTHHLIDRDRLRLMKQSTVLVNTARGEIIDTAALVDALQNNVIAGAALDVVEGEALLNHAEEAALLRSEDIDPELLRHRVEISLLKKMPNVIISPHNAFNTIEAVQRINQTTADNIIQYWYDAVPNRVKPPTIHTGKLVVIRHAESEWNATGQWSGIRDVHLSDKGFHESGMLGRQLRTLHISIDVAYCSQQIRTRETLEGVIEGAQQFDVEVHRNDALNERDYGDYTGKNKWEMKELIGEKAWNDIRRGWNVAVPGGETLQQVYKRVVPFYTNDVLPQLRNGKNILIVAHGNSIRALMKYIESLSDEAIESCEMLFGEIVVYDVDDTGIMKQKSATKIDSLPPHA